MKMIICLAFFCLIGCKSAELKTVNYYQNKNEPYQQAVIDGIRSWNFPVKRLNTPISSAVTVSMVKWGKDGSQGEYHKDIKTVFINIESRQYKNLDISKLKYWNEIPFNDTHAKVLVAHEMGHYFGLKDYTEAYASPDIAAKKTTMNTLFLNEWDKLPTQEDIDHARKNFR